MDLARMLDKCVRDQWTIDDLDWSIPPPRMSRKKEEAVVQCFTDMAAIELFAGALFEVQQRKTDDPVLKKIFATFVADEKRHSAVATRLATHYDAHHFRRYEESPSLTRFRPHFLSLVEHTSPEIANAYITAGELILDVALLRSLDDYVDDEMSAQAMHLINRDESRHIAVDFHMTEKYASEEHMAALRARGMPLPELARGTWRLGLMMWYAKPFLQDVFLAPMDVTDPTGRRVQEAFKRIQLLMRKTSNTPFAKLMYTAQRLYNMPVIGKLLGRGLLRVMGADERAARILYTREDEQRVWRMSWDEFAEDALAAKYS
jgi:hypothetical protein